MNLNDQFQLKWVIITQSVFKDAVHCLLVWMSVVLKWCTNPQSISANTKESIFVISLTPFQVI